MAINSSRPMVSVRVALISAVIYILCMGASMTLLPLAGVTYGAAEMVYPLSWTMPLLCVLVALFVRFRTSWRAVGVVPPARGALWWWLPVAICLAVMAIPLVTAIAGGITAAQWGLLGVIIFVTLCVGFAEEIMFRGILMHAVLARLSAPIAVLISAAGFALLHSVNVLGGSSFSAMLQQLLSTFIAGLFYGSMVVLTKSIVPGMIVHFLWDFILLGLAGVTAEQPDVSYTIATLTLAYLAPIVFFAVVIVRHFIHKRRVTQA